MDQDDLDDKFSKMTAEQNDQYDNAAVGMVSSILAQCAAEAQADESQARTSRGKKNAASSSGAQEASASSPQRKRRHTGVIVESDNGQSPPAKGRRGGSGATSASKPRSAMKSKGGGGGRQQSGTESTVATAPGRPSPAKPSDGLAAAVEDDDPKRRGRPSKPLDIIAQEHVVQFNTSGEDSLYFGEKSETQLRSVQRYLHQLNAKLISTRDREVQTQLEEAKKSLQIVEAGIKIYRAWRASGFVGLWGRVRCPLLGACGALAQVGQVGQR